MTTLKDAAARVVRMYNAPRSHNGPLYTAIIQLESALRQGDEVAANIIINVDKAEVQRAIDKALESMAGGKVMYATEGTIDDLEAGYNLVSLSASKVGLYKRKCLLVVLP
jgi:hypothetical protein